MQMRKALIFCKVKWGKKKTIKEMRDKKAAGDDYVPGYILLLLGEDGLRTMTQLIYNTYKTGEWLKISLKLQ